MIEYTAIYNILL